MPGALGLVAFGGCLGRAPRPSWNTPRSLSLSRLFSTPHPTHTHPKKPKQKGGGAALLHLSELVPAFRATLTNEEERLGADIVMKALRAPARLIADNAGVEGEVIVQKLMGTPFEVGYNAMTDTIEVGGGGGVVGGRERGCV